MDLIERQAAIDAMKNMYEAAEKWGRETTDDVIKTRAESYMASLIEMKLRIEKLPSAQLGPLIKDGIVISRNLCDSCINNGCIFQYGIVRNHCDFYKAEGEDKSM